MRTFDAVCAHNDRPAGVTFSFQVCEYSIKPPVPNRSFNLLPNNDDRLAGFDELEKDGPEMAFVVNTFTLPGAGERLAWETGAPNRSSCRPSCEVECPGPA